VTRRPPAAPRDESRGALSAVRGGVLDPPPPPSAPRVGVVGHVEWVQFARVPRVPLAGEIVHASDVFAVPGGGGAVAAVQLARLAGSAVFFTALGTGAHAERAGAELRALGVTVVAGSRSAPQRRTFTFLDDDAERTITVLGERIVPQRADPLPWESLAQLDAIYLTGGDAGAVRAARAARVLVATPRALGALVEAGVTLDVLVGSATDPGEVCEPGTLSPEPRVVVRTRGGDGGSWEAREPAPDEPDLPWLPAGARRGTWAATPLPGPKADAYGCGDAFAAALAYGLGAGMTLDDAIGLAARCGASVLTGRGPYGAMLGARA
jgi:ribokinase